MTKSFSKVFIVVFLFTLLFLISNVNSAYATVTAYQFPNVISDGTLDTDCGNGTKITFATAQTVQLINSSTASCATSPAKEDKILMTVTSTAEQDLVMAYFANGGYNVNTVVTGQAIGNDIYLKIKSVNGTGNIRLVEVNPSTGVVISTLDTHSFAMTLNVKYTTTDLSGLTGTVSSGNTFGIKLSITPDSTTSTQIETKFGTYGSTQKQDLINVDETISADTTAPSAVSDLVPSGATASTIDLDWTAPGDDASSGTANAYDVRYSASVINDGNWGSATPVSGEPTPSVAGSAENMTITGLLSNTTYYFAIKTSDEVPNESAISNLPSLSTSAVADTTAPSAVSDLATSGATANTIDLDWSAPGDDESSGTATTYDIRYSTSAINDGNWASDTTVAGEPTPSVAGSAENMTVTGLVSDTTYFFAIKTSDEVPNESMISNVPSLSTSAPADTTAPSAVSDLALSGATTSTIDLDWTAPGDDASSGTATTYDIRYSTSVINGGNWDSATTVVGEPSPAVASTAESMTVTGLSANTTYYFAIKTSDEVPNESSISNVPNLSTSATADTTPPSAVSDFAASGATTSTIDLDWSSPGDDASSGTATSYDIRYSTATINDGNFSSATAVTGEPAPLVAGTAENMTVSGLTSNTTYYFAIKTSDEAPNVSAISNIPNLSTAVSVDTTAPSTISNLALSGETTSTIDLDWTASGDDASSGTTTSYDIRYSTSVINDSNWASATAVSGEPTPSVAGSSENMTVTGLSANTTYYFAIKVSDEVPNESPISNVPNLATSAEAEEPTIVIPASGGGVAASKIHLAGQAYPNSKIEVLRKGSLDTLYKNIPIEQSAINDDGTFSILHLGLLGADYLIALRVEDKDGRQTGIISFNVNLASEDLVVTDIFVPPTVGFENSIVKKGADVHILGYAAPNNIIELEIGGIKKETTSNASGLYELALSTNNLSVGSHSVRARQIASSTSTSLGQATEEIRSSGFGVSRTFRLSSLSVPLADFNNDSKIGITDWSIFLFRWGSKQIDLRSRIDLDGNGIINISDFSIFLRVFNL